MCCHNVNSFEKMITDDNIILLKFYFSISKETQEKRFKEIKNSSLKKWKFTEVDSKAQKLWDKYTKYKDEMFKKTNTVTAPWNIISADRKIYARIKVIQLILILKGHLMLVVLLYLQKIHFRVFLNHQYLGM